MRGHFGTRTYTVGHQCLILIFVKVMPRSTMTLDNIRV
jgi:hypothetical protein